MHWSTRTSKDHELKDMFVISSAFRFYVHVHWQLSRTLAVVYPTILKLIQGTLYFK